MTGAPHGPGPVVSAPFVSVIVPVFRHWDLAPALLEALAGQAPAAGDVEILLIDNDAETPPPALALPENARILACAAPGSYAARNAGAAEARGTWLVFTDADCRPDPGWLAAFAPAMAATPSDLLAGPVRMTAPARPSAAAIHDLVRGIPQAAYVARGYAATANLAVPAAVFRALGGFDAARFSGGDADLCRRAGREGHALRLVAGAVVAHPARTDWEAVAAKARRVKGGQVAAGPRARRLAWSLRTLVPPFRESLSYLARPHPWRHRLVAVAVRFRLWGVELAETARLLAGGTPERR